MSSHEIGPTDSSESPQGDAKPSYKDKYFAYLSEVVGPGFTGADIQGHAFSWPGAPEVEGVYEDAYMAYIGDLAQNHDQINN